MLKEFYSFGTSQRDDSLEKNRKELPGPGTYQLKNIIGTEGPQRTMGAKATD